MELEICVDSLAGLEAAITGGADRIELCSALALGGLTPSEALLQAATAAPVPVYVMIRPRAGDFLFTTAELGAMEAEIARVRSLGLAGVVLGAGSEAGPDMGALRRLVTASEGLGRTLHRVIDLFPDPAAPLPEIAAMGFERVLTSGGAKTAAAGAATIARMVRQAPAGLSVMAGSGITAGNAAALIAETGIRAVHGSASAPGPAPAPRLVELGFAPPQPRITSATEVARLADVIRAL